MWLGVAAGGREGVGAGGGHWTSVAIVVGVPTERDLSDGRCRWVLVGVAAVVGGYWRSVAGIPHCVRAAGGLGDERREIPEVRREGVWVRERYWRSAAGSLYCGWRAGGAGDARREELVCG